MYCKDNQLIPIVIQIVATLLRQLQLIELTHRIGFGFILKVDIRFHCKIGLPSILMNLLRPTGKGRSFILNFYQFVTLLQRVLLQSTLFAIIKGLGTS